MTGGSGINRFTFTAINHSTSTPDTILNFDVTGDPLVFNGLPATRNIQLVGTHSNAFAGSGNLSVRFNDITKLMESDTNSDASADMTSASSAYPSNLSAADFNWS